MPPASRSLIPQLENMAAMVQGAWSEDPAVQLEATTQFRKLLSIGEKREGRKKKSGGVKACCFCSVPRCGGRVHARLILTPLG